MRSAGVDLQAGHALARLAAGSKGQTRGCALRPGSVDAGPASVSLATERARGASVAFVSVADRRFTAARSFGPSSLFRVADHSFRERVAALRASQARFGLRGFAAPPARHASSVGAGHRRRTGIVLAAAQAASSQIGIVTPAQNAEREQEREPTSRRSRDDRGRTRFAQCTCAISK